MFTILADGNCWLGGQKTIQNKATSLMLPRISTVVQDVEVQAAGLFQCIAEDGKVAISSFLQDGAGHDRDAPIVPRQEFRIEELHAFGWKAVAGGKESLSHCDF